MCKIPNAIRCGPFALVTTASSLSAGSGWAATGTVHVEIARAGFVVGGGRGTLVFQGRRYPLSVGATIGASKSVMAKCERAAMARIPGVPWAFQHVCKMLSGLAGLELGRP